MSTVAARLELIKTIHAPVEKVFAAWTKPELIARWLAPGNSAVLESAIDLRVGGRYRIRMKGEMNGAAYDVVASGIYERIVPNELLSFTWTFEDEERRRSVGNSVVTVALKAMSDGTELTLIHEKLATQEAHDGHQSGWASCMEKLEAFLVSSD